MASNKAGNKGGGKASGGQQSGRPVYPDNKPSKKYRGKSGDGRTNNVPGTQS